MTDHKDHKQEETFRVIDRRLFNAEGELRQEAVDEERKQQETKPKAAAPVSVLATDSTAAPASTPAAAAVPTAKAVSPSPSFKNLLAFLARNAELVMAGMPDPRTGRQMVDVESLRQLIDMMEVLKEKTTGNLAAEDEQLLTDVIGDLKVSYLQLEQAALAQQATAQRAGRKP